jgi:hypothetical protein
MKNKNEAVGTCGHCGQPMDFNVPRLGHAGGYVHRVNREFSCPETGEENKKTEKRKESHTFSPVGEKVGQRKSPRTGTPTPQNMKAEVAPEIYRSQDGNQTLSLAKQKGFEALESDDILPCQVEVHTFKTAAARQKFLRTPIEGFQDAKEGPNFTLLVEKDFPRREQPNPIYINH